MEGTVFTISLQEETCSCEESKGFRGNQSPFSHKVITGGRTWEEEGEDGDSPSVQPVQYKKGARRLSLTPPCFIQCATH